MKKDRTATRKEMPFLDHLEELRWRIIKSLVPVLVFMTAGFPFTGKVLDLLTLPNNHLAHPAKLIFLKPTGMLMVRMEMSLAIGLMVSTPIILYQIWQFIAPGLLPKEKRWVLPGIFFTTLCFLVGAFFAYAVLIPVILPFLFGMGTDTIQATININDYIGFVIRLMLMSGLIFELPVLSFALSRIGILNPRFLRKYRRHAIVLIFIFAAIVTPPEPVSQCLLAIPLVFLYEISILVSRFAYRKRNRHQSDSETVAGSK